MFCLSGAGDAPQLPGNMSAHGAPTRALVLRCFGILAAVVVKHFVSDDAVTTMMSTSLFGAIVTWLMIFVTHHFFRRAIRNNGETLAHKVPAPAAFSLLGAALMPAILFTTAFAPGVGLTLVYGVPTLV